MSQDQEFYFTSNRAIYWPAEFNPIVNLFKGLNELGETIPEIAPMYQYNTYPVVLAAIIGLVNNRQRDVGSQRNEIMTDTFENHKYRGVRLAAFLFLIPLIGKQEIDLLRPENEDLVLRTFEKYCAGGFEYLRGALSESYDDNGEAVLQSEVRRAMESWDMGLVAES